MKKTRVSVRSRILEVLKELHGAQTSYVDAKALYHKKFGGKLDDTAFYTERKKLRLAQEAGKKKAEVMVASKQTLTPNFLAAAEKESETPITIGPEKLYALSDLRTVSEVAKKVGWLDSLQRIASVLQELQ